MPFITQQRRDMILADMIPDQELTQGDRCYKHYRLMVTAWNMNPRWTTADNIYREAMYDRALSGAEQRAKELAWQVFFQLKVIPYELQKQSENGDV